jgi:hypothetical protein
MNLPIPARITQAGSYQWTEPIIHNTLGPAIDIQCDDVSVHFTNLILLSPTDYDINDIQNKQYGILANKRSNIRINGTRIVNMQHPGKTTVYGAEIRDCKGVVVNVKESVGFDGVELKDNKDMRVINCNWDNCKLLNNTGTIIHNSSINGIYYQPLLPRNPTATESTVAVIGIACLLMRYPLKTVLRIVASMLLVALLLSLKM